MARRTAERSGQSERSARAASGPRVRPRSSLPSLRLIIGSLLAAVVTGSLLGLVLGVVSPAGPTVPEAATTTTTPTVSAAAPATSSPAADSQAPARTTSTSPSVSITTVMLQPAAAPATVIADPASDRSLSLGILQSVDDSDPTNVTLWVTKATMLTGAKARAYARQQGEQPRDTVVVATGSSPQQYRLSSDAALWGTFVIGDGQHADQQRFALSDFLDIIDGVLAQNEHPAIWIEQSLDLAGPVIYLAEQYPA